MKYYLTILMAYVILMLIIKPNVMNKFNWKKLLLDVLKVVAGALAGWLGAGQL